MKIKFTEDNTLQMLPAKATSGSAAYDLYVPRDIVIERGRQIVKLGFCIELDAHTAAEIHPRSGYAAKGMEGYEIIKKKVVQGDMRLGGYTEAESGQYASLESSRFDANVIYGLVDEDYRGEVGVIINNNDGPFLVKSGTRIAQMLIVPCIEVPIEVVIELSDTDRKGGFGSTNNK